VVEEIRFKWKGGVRSTRGGSAAAVALTKEKKGDRIQ